MPKVNRVTDRAHTILSFDLNQRDFPLFVEELRKSKFFPNLIGIEVKRPNYGNPVLGLGALMLQEIQKEDDTIEEVVQDVPQEEEDSTNEEDESIIEEGDPHDSECN